LHYDLKPDNILLKSSDKHSLESSEIVLIDYGMSREYTVDNQHVKMREDVKFRGNLLF
jgi:serine/threonine protein kinase